MRRCPPLERGVLAALQAAVMEVDLAPIHEDYAHIARKIRLLGVTLSDRKLVKGLKLIAASALLRGSLVAGREDPGRSPIWCRAASIRASCGTCCMPSCSTAATPC
jgi:hypothetical protein